MKPPCAQQVPSPSQALQAWPLAAMAATRLVCRLPWTTRCSAALRASCGRCATCALVPRLDRPMRTDCCVWLAAAQVVKRHDAEAMWVGLGKGGAQSQTQLDGFKTRVLRAGVSEQQRHLYMTAWCSVASSSASPMAVLVLTQRASLPPHQPAVQRRAAAPQA